MPCSLLLPKRPPILRRGRGDQRGPLVVSQLRGVPGVQARRLVYETRRSGLLVINVTSEVEVTDGAWHELIIKQTPAILPLPAQHEPSPVSPTSSRVGKKWEKKTIIARRHSFEHIGSKEKTLVTSGD